MNKHTHPYLHTAGRGFLYLSPGPPIVCSAGTNEITMPLPLTKHEITELEEVANLRGFDVITDERWETIILVAKANWRVTYPVLSFNEGYAYLEGWKDHQALIEGEFADGARTTPPPPVPLDDWAEGMA